MRRVPISGAVVVLIASLGMADIAWAQSRLTGLMFRRADTNSDDHISQAEMRVMRETGFARVDADGDGRITQAEAQASASRMQRFRQSGDAPPADPGRAITRFDANGDGEVSRAEFVDGPAEIFSLADTNGDQALSRAEADAFFAELQSARAARAQ